MKNDTWQLLEVHRKHYIISIIKIYQGTACIFEYSSWNVLYYLSQSYCGVVSTVRLFLLYQKGGYSMFIVVVKSGEYNDRFTELIGVYETFSLVQKEFGEFEILEDEHGEREYCKELECEKCMICYEVPLNKRCESLHALD